MVTYVVTDQFPLQRNQPATIQRKSACVKILEPGGEAEVPVWTTESKKDHIRKVEDWLYTTASPIHQAGIELYWEGPSRPIVSSRGKESPKWKHSFLSVVGTSWGPLGLPSGDH